MSKAEELADALDAMRIDPALCHHMVVPEVEAAAAELRRLAQVEAEHAALLKAISDAEPVAWRSPDDTESVPKLVWLREKDSVFLGYHFEQPFREYRDSDGFYVGQQDAESYWARYEDGDPCEPDGWCELKPPLYTLNGIKP